uniref:Oxysterol-binding protein n=1 Tax=Sparus aurata TaxID=8175 RepID=A0A671WCA8_SPAAU
VQRRVSLSPFCKCGHVSRQTSSKQDDNLCFYTLAPVLSCHANPKLSNFDFPFKVPQICRLILGAVMSEPKTPTPVPAGDTYKGWVFKWTNYIKGYQRRWFVLSNGLLSYYRTQAEMGHTCRGTINLATATITVDDACNFVISNGGAQTYHLKASCEVERQRWITALELAKAKAARMQAESGKTNKHKNTEVQSALRTLGSKVEDLSTCNDLISKHGSALQRSLSELDSLRLTGEAGDKIRQVTERATLFRITSNAMINACRDFLALAQAHSKRWQKALQAERDQRVRLEETLEQLAKQHNHLERAFRGAAQANATADNKSSAGPGKGEASDEDDDNEFFDAMEEAPEFITVPADPQFHKSESPSQELVPLKKRRTRIADKPNYSLNLWSIMKNCIGKELSKIPMPVNFNEPISMLQRLSEDLEYHELLDKASKCQSSLEQMCYVAAFSVSSYSTTVHRTGKPFNPLLGETYELDRRRESGYRSLCEQVSHHPPAAAHHAISDRGWTLRQEITVASKFRGKYLSIMPLGTIHAIFEKGNNHYTWKKVTTTVHNIIVGKLWIDQSGEIDVVNHTTGDRCHLKFAPYSYFSRDVARKVTGVVMDKDGKAHYVLSGTWDEKMEFSRVMQSSRGGENGTEGKQKTVYQTLKAREVWRRNPLPEGAESMYYFTDLALTLNEPEEGVAPTDSRRRPDQRLMEDGRWDEANSEKQRLEEKQRIARREREREAASQRTSSQSEDSAPHENYQALWFERCEDRITGEQVHIYKGGYWEAKDRGSFEGCPDIF